MKGVFGMFEKFSFCVKPGCTKYTTSGSKSEAEFQGIFSKGIALTKQKVFAHELNIEVASALNDSLMIMTDDVDTL